MVEDVAGRRDHQHSHVITGRSWRVIRVIVRLAANVAGAARPVPDLVGRGFCTKMPPFRGRGA